MQLGVLLGVPLGTASIFGRFSFLVLIFDDGTSEFQFVTGIEIQFPLAVTIFVPLAVTIFVGGFCRIADVSSHAASALRPHCVRTASALF